MPTLEFDKRSLRTLEKQLLKAREAAIAGGSEGLLDFAEEVMTESLEQVPVETGTLKNSAFVDEPTENEEGVVQIRVGYGRGEANPLTGKHPADYMVPVHERLDVHHPVGNAKFLEGPLMSSLQDFSARLVISVKDKMRRVLTR